jgi:hypothetical protein
MSNNGDVHITENIPLVFLWQFEQTIQSLFVLLEN